MSLDLRAVNLYLSRRHVVRSLDLNLAPGEVVGLLGPNGAGKTTTFDIIIGQRQPHSGTVILDDRSIIGLSMSARARLGLGYLPQEASIFRSLTVRENLLMSAERSMMPAATRHQRLSELIEDFQLGNVLQRQGAQLSGGERRRTEVARALATSERGPRYLLLDEPFAGVDPLAVSDLQALILRLKQRGVGVLITDHNVRETLSIIDRAYILSEGSVLASGPSSSIINDPLVRRHYLGKRFTL